MDNFKRYIDLLSTINRDGVSDLIEYIKTTDFNTAPASTLYHKNTSGGLCEHSLNVYDNMIKLRDIFEPDLPDETVKVVSLLHDISKVGFYQKYVQNKKVYSPSGYKQDELGNFDWVSVSSFKTKDPSERDLIIGEHGVNSFYLVNKYIKLTDEEAAAIINHHAGMDNGYVLKDLNEAMNRYPALTLLHMADLAAVYFQENPYLVKDE